jgi:hypothetical protein
MELGVGLRKGQAILDFLRSPSWEKSEVPRTLRFITRAEADFRACHGKLTTKDVATGDDGLTTSVTTYTPLNFINILLNSRTMMERCGV